MRWMKREAEGWKRSWKVNTLWQGKSVLKKSSVKKRVLGGFGQLCLMGGTLLGVGMFCMMLATPTRALDGEWSAAVSVPQGTWLNSVYVFGTPINGVTARARLNEKKDLEFSGFIGTTGLVVVGVDYFEELAGGRAYSLIGISSLLAANVGGGVYLLKPEPFGIRFQHVALVTPFGHILGSNTGGPLIFGWTSLLATYKF